jgi:large subunit ribosomal protein L3
MTIGVVGRKAGMTRIFTEDGASIPVSVVEVLPNRITQIKTDETDGYRAIQVTTGKRRESRVTKPMAGHFAKAGVESGRGLWEFRISGDEAAEMQVGGEVGIGMFEAGQKIDVIGRSIGKDSRVVSSATIFPRRICHTVTRFHTVQTVQSVCARRRVASSRARKCPVTWVT